MTSQNADPNYIDLDDLHLNTPQQHGQTVLTSDTATPPPQLNLDEFEVDNDPFSEFSFDDLMALEEIPSPAPLATQSQSQTTLFNSPQNPASIDIDALASATPQTQSQTHTMTPENGFHQSSQFLNEIPELTNSAADLSEPVKPTLTQPVVSDTNHLDFNFDDALTPPSPTLTSPSNTPTSDLTGREPLITSTGLEQQPTLDIPLSNTSVVDTPPLAPNVATDTLTTAAAVGMAGATALATPPTPSTQPTPPAPPSKKPFGLSLGKNLGKTPEATAPKAKAAPKSLFGKKEKPPVSASVPPSHPTAPMGASIAKPKKNNLLPLILLGALAALAGGWWFLNQPEPTPAAPTPVAKKSTATPPASAAPATSVSAVANASAPMATMAGSAPAGTITNNSIAKPATAPTSSSATASTPTLSKTAAIKPEDITTPALPADNATAKEEMDRLAQQSQQLSEQEKMMEEQLKMMNELSSKKEERIAILEKQIAQLEAQKGQTKK